MTSFTIPNTFTPSTVISSSEMNANFTAVNTAFGISLGIDGAETMTGTFKAASGTAALPGITFGADPDLGLFRKAANTLGFAAGGAEIGNWDASNLNLLAGLTVAGSLSLTAASPRINLTDSDTGADSRIDADNATGSLVYSADLNNEAGSSTHVWALDGTNQMVLTTAALTPAADDGLTLGTASLQWADLFLASGAVINFNNGNATLTHSADTLNFSVTNLQHGGTALATATDVQKTNVQTFNASGTWTKPSGYNATCPVLIRAWGAGGSGAQANSGNGGGAGGGGAYSERWAILSALGATETVTIGAGGASVTTPGHGSAGGNTTFGSSLTAYGGGGGASNANGGGGGGGGSIAAGSDSTTATGANGGGLIGGTGGNPGGDSIVGGGGGGTGALGGADGGQSHFGGGGGGGGDNGAVSGGDGGNSHFGGAGGGGGSDGGTPGGGGTSIIGGDGGAGATGANNATAGTQPGGGGGGSETGDSGAGAGGRVEVYVFSV